VLYARRTIKIEYVTLDGIMLIGARPVFALPGQRAARG